MDRRLIEHAAETALLLVYEIEALLQEDDVLDGEEAELADVEEQVSPFYGIDLLTGFPLEPVEEESE